MEGKVYVVSDLHGSLKIFKALLERIQFSDEDHLYIIGDICDRGPDSLAIYMLIRNYINITLIKGNHELMAQEALKKAIFYNDFDYPSNEFHQWEVNGGNTTIENIRNYLKKNCLNHLEYTIVRNAFLNSMYNYFLNLPKYVELNVNNQDYILVHAGIDPQNINIAEQDEEILLWVREYFQLSPCDLNKVYIFGHTPTCFLNDDHSFKVWHDPIYHNKLGIDGGLAMGGPGQLNCVCLNTMEEILLKHKDYL